jgi:phosphoribosylamine--glycine ligase
MQILIVGSGAREHALALAVSRSPLCTKIYAAPGNPGMAGIAELAAIPVTETERLVAFADNREIDFVIVGPDAPLALGLVDAMTARGILTFGPTRMAARLESSKAFTKDLCRAHGIPTAAAETFADVEAAQDYVRTQGLPIVIKADGLALGKGVTIARTLEEADAAIEEALTGGRFGEAGERILIEEFLEGEEASFFALVDGRRAIPFASAQDHKAAWDGDKGPNTGGMGAYSPAPVVTPEVEARIMDQIVLPTVNAMAADGSPFRGVLYAGLMIRDGEPKLIEYNTRFGDPECQVLMARLDDDILPLLMACAGGDMGRLRPSLKPDAAMTVVMASEGYPGEIRLGDPITGIEEAEQNGAKVLHAGTKLDGEGRLVTSGGRVLAVTATASTLPEARELAYDAVGRINWRGAWCRRDIGWRALARETGDL